MPEVFEITATVELGFGAEAVDKSHAEQRAREMITKALAELRGGSHPQIRNVKVQVRTNS